MSAKAVISQAGENINALPPIVKGVLTVIAIVGAVIIIRKVIKKSSEVSNDMGMKHEGQAVADDLEKLNSNPSTKQKISNATASSIANTLFKAMDGMGTWDNVVIRQFYYLHNDADFLAVQSAFATKAIASGWGGKTKFTLQSALSDELDDGEIAKINAILAKKGIKKRI